METIHQGDQVSPLSLGQERVTSLLRSRNAGKVSVSSRAGGSGVLAGKPRHFRSLSSQTGNVRRKDSHRVRASLSPGSFLGPSKPFSPPQLSGSCPEGPAQSPVPQWQQKEAMPPPLCQGGGRTKKQRCHLMRWRPKAPSQTSLCRSPATS